MRVSRVGLLLAAGAFALTGCKPDSVTAARDQLGRGPSRTVQFTLPLAIDTFTIGEFLADSGLGADTATTPSGIRAVRFDPESIAVDVGDELVFNNITFDAFTFSYDQMLLTDEVSTNISLPAPPLGAPRPSAPFLAAMATPDTVRFDTPDGSSVTGATVATGFIVRTLVNGTNCDATVGVALTDGTGGTVVAFLNALVLQGTTLIDSVDAAGATVNQFVSVDPTATFGACVPSSGNIAADFTFRPFVLASVNLQNVNETFNQDYAALASETRLQAIDTIALSSGSLTLTAQNRLPVALSLDLTIQGITVGGVVVQRTFNVPAAPGNGSTVQAVLIIDLAGAVVVPGAVLATAQGTATAPTATITSLVTTSAVTVDGDGSATADRLVGVLDPAQTPELTVAVENFEEVNQDAVDFGDFEDAVRGATINDGVFTFSIANQLQTPITLSSYTVGLALTDVAGNPVRDVGGNIIYLTDGVGAPLLLTVAQPGQTQLLLPPAGSVSVQLTTVAPLLDRLVHLVLSDTSVALVGAGDAIVGDGVAVSRINANDVIVVNLAALVGLDLTLPDSGVVFSVTGVVDGLGFDSLDAENLADRLVDARATSEVGNGVPFRVEVEIAIIEGDRGDTVDVFTLPGHITLSTVTLLSAAVDPLTGRATGLTAGTAEAILTAADSRALFGEFLTTTVRIRIRPPTGSGGRGALVSGDPLIVNARAAVSFTTGGAQ